MLAWVRKFTYLSAAKNSNKEYLTYGKVNIKSEKITPFGGIYYASKAFYALSLDKVINGTLGVRSSTYNGCTFARGFRPCFRQDGKSRCDVFV